MNPGMFGVIDCQSPSAPVVRVLFVGFEVNSPFNKNDWENRPGVGSISEDLFQFVARGGEKSL
jgi:hypothetical protein